VSFLLPVPYFHVVFTLPSEVAEIAFHNKAVVYGILFDAVAATLKTIAADPRHFGGEIGFLAILHTWGQALTHHPHIHCLVPGGGLGSDERCLDCRPNFFLPVHVLSRLFRRLFLERLQAGHAAGRLRFSGKLAGFEDADVFAAAIRKLRRKSWIVYAKPPFGSPEHVLAYLGRYTHRVAIANSRLVSATDASVTFNWRDYRHGNAPRLVSLHPHEFIRRFLIHSLRDGFHRIRHYGLLANGCRRARLATIRQILTPTGAIATVAAEVNDTAKRLTRFDPTQCPCCGGILRVTAAMAHRATATLARYVMTTRDRSSIKPSSVAAAVPTSATIPYVRYVPVTLAEQKCRSAARPNCRLVKRSSRPIPTIRCRNYLHRGLGSFRPSPQRSGLLH